MEPTTAPRPSLPPLHLLDSRRDEAEQQRPASTLTSATATPTPFSHPQSSYTPASQARFRPAPQQSSSYGPDLVSRSQESRDAREPASSTPRQSLPSLSEALGVSDTASPRSIHHSHDSPPARRDVANPSPPRAPLNLPYPPTEQHPSGHYPSADMPDYRRRDYPEQTHPTYRHRSPAAASLQVRPQLPPSEPDSYHRAPPPTQQFPFGYAPANGTYAPPPPTMAPSHRPSIVSPALEQGHAWQASRSGVAQPPPPASVAYSDNVKRHLDFYDLEMALSEICQFGAVMADFGKTYTDRLQHAHRSGIVDKITLPAIQDIDHLMIKSRKAHETMARLHETLAAQQAAEHYAQEQRHLASARVDSFHQPEEMKLASTDTKKRRGRNAAPGRCHSCNRAETPEWRRGPDGARTLCNACGLHYAKLTRKAGQSKATVEGSSARTKSNEDSA